MYCQKCGKEIDNEAVICPSCGVSTNNTKQKPKKKKKHGCLIGIIIILIIFVLFLVIVFSGDDTAPSDDSNTQQTTEYITLEEFDRIKTGMTYEEVVEIVGCEGKLVTSSEFETANTKTYGWSSKDMGGITYGATVAFIDNKVSWKQQIGLDLVDDVSEAISNTN